jgi:hypothetical protein
MKRNNEILSELAHKNPTKVFGGLENAIILTTRNALIHQGNQVVGEIDYIALIPSLRLIYHAEEKSNHYERLYNKVLQQNNQHDKFLTNYIMNQRYDAVTGFYFHDKTMIEKVTQ